MPDFITRLYCRALAYASRDEGQGITEYALLIALVALVAIVALTLLGGGVKQAYSGAGNGI